MYVPSVVWFAVTRAFMSDGGTKLVPLKIMTTHPKWSAL